MKSNTIAAMGLALATLSCASAAAAQDWSGTYAGLNAGYAAGQGRLSGAASETDNLNGAAVGLDVGHNWQKGALVFGLEGDASYLSAHGSKTTLYSINVGGFPLFLSNESKTEVNFVGDLRARVGRAFGPNLIYVLAGVSLGDGRGLYNGSGSSKAAFGGAAGVGYERLFKAGWGGRLEYTYTGFGKISDSGLSDQVDLHRITFGVFRKF